MRSMRHFTAAVFTAVALTILAAQGAGLALETVAGSSAAPGGADRGSSEDGAATSPVATSPHAAEADAAKDPRPLVRLIVRNDFKPEDKLFPQLVEGRLVADLADMETFRTAGHDAPNADYVLTCSIRDIAYNASTVYTTTKDADSSGRAEPSDQVLLSMDLTFTLEDREGKLVHSGKLSSSASHEMEKSAEYTANILKQEMIDRAAQRLERIIRKKIRSGRRTGGS